MSQPFMEIDHLRELTLARDLSPHILTAGAFGYFVEPPGNGLHHLFFCAWMGAPGLAAKSCNWIDTSAGKRAACSNPQCCWGRMFNRSGVTKACRSAFALFRPRQKQRSSQARWQGLTVKSSFLSVAGRRWPGSRLPAPVLALP